MGKLTYKDVKIEILYSNIETRKIGIKEGDVFEGKQEFLNGKPKSNIHFTHEDNDCVAYDAQHDEDAYILVTTCRIVPQDKPTITRIDSDINRIQAQIKQLNSSELFSTEDRERLTPIYQAQLEALEQQKIVNHEVIEPQILSNGNSEE